MKRSSLRFMLVSFVLTMLMMGTLTAPANAAPGDDSEVVTPAWTVFDEGGYWGRYLYEDNSSHPGGECWNTGTTVDISLTGPWLYAHSLYYYQPVTVQWQIFKILSNGDGQEVARSRVYSARAYYNSPAVFGDITFFDLPIGPKYVGVARLTWYDEYGQVFGYSDARYDYYSSFLNGGSRGVKSACSSPYSPTATLTPTSGTVNSTVNFSVSSYPANTTIAIRWDGTVISTFKTGSGGRATGSFKVPAAPMGAHKVRFSVGSIGTERTFTVKPRIKVTPGTTARGQIVNVSLRGYKAAEVVRIRWKKADGTWVELKRVTTSGTGSKNVDVRVPAWAPIGANSVRGDSISSTGGHAQTNAVTVSGGATNGSAVKTPTPTATPSPKAASTATATPSPTPTIAPTQTPEATATAVPSEPVETVIPETPTAEPTIDAPQPSPTEMPTGTPEASATQPPVVETPTVAPES